MKTALIILSLLIFSVINSSAGNNQTKNIFGKIVDKETLEPLYGVSVSLPDSKNPIGTITNSKGEFRLWHLPGSSTDLVISCNGYDPINVSIEEITISDQSGLIIELESKHKAPNKQKLQQQREAVKISGKA